MSKINTEVFAEFRENLKDVIELSNGNESFEAKVIYEWGENIEEEVLQVTLSLTTFEYGKITFEEGEVLNIESVHTEFYSEFQTYSLTDEDSLLIEGNSPRLGNYKVTIIKI